MAVKYIVAHRNARLDALTTALGTSCLIRIYTSGTAPQPGPAVAITDQVLLATLTGGAAAFAAAAAAGVLTANAITLGTAGNTGTATWARLLTSGGSAIADISVTVAGGGGDLQLTGTAVITSGLDVSCTSLVITEGNP